MRESSQPCGQANNQLPRTIPTPEPKKEFHGPSDTPERSEKSATFDVHSTRSFHSTSDNVLQRSFSSAAATVAGRSGGECRSVTELSQRGMKLTTSFPGIGMRCGSIGNQALVIWRFVSRSAGEPQVYAKHPLNLIMETAHSVSFGNRTHSHD